LRTAAVRHVKDATLALDIGLSTSGTLHSWSSSKVEHCSGTWSTTQPSGSFTAAKVKELALDDRRAPRTNCSIFLRKARVWTKNLIEWITQKTQKSPDPADDDYLVFTHHFHSLKKHLVNQPLGARHRQDPHRDLRRRQPV
jgi:hypothetical protein